MSGVTTRKLLGGGVLALALVALGLGLRAGGGEARAGQAALPDTLGEVQLVETTAVTAGTDGVVEGGTEAATPGDPAAGEADGLARATFGGGCFWCMEPPFDGLEGVRSTVSGFAGGEIVDPSYDQVASGRTEHREVVQVTYDPGRVSYTRLLEVYWHNVDPVDGGGQFCDRGHQYSPAIFVHNEEQGRLARASLERLEAAIGGAGDTDGPTGAGGNRSAADGPVAVEILPLDAFYAAEDYHQDFYEKNPGRYYGYREGCRRDERLREVWGEAAGH